MPRAQPFHLLLVALWVMAALVGSADHLEGGILYKWTDEQGVIHLSDIPPPQGESAGVRVYQFRGSAGQEPGAPPSPSEPPAGRGTGDGEARPSSTEEPPAQVDPKAPDVKREEHASSLERVRPVYDEVQADRRIARFLYNRILGFWREGGSGGLERYLAGVEGERIRVEAELGRLQQHLRSLRMLPVADLEEEGRHALDLLKQYQTQNLELLRTLERMLRNPAGAAPETTVAGNLVAQVERVDRELEPLFSPSP